MGNSRVKDRFELALDGKQVIALGIGVTVLVAGVFVLGMNLGRRSVIAAAPIVAPKDPLARLDEPLALRDDSVELKAHQALTDSRSIDKSLPVPQVKATTVAIAPAPPPARVEAARADPVLAERGAAESKRAVPVAPVRPERSAAESRREAPANPVRAERSAAESKRGPSVAMVAPASARTPTRPEKPAASANLTPKKGAYSIQVASLPSRGDAEKVAKQHAARNPRIVQADIPGKGRYYRVLVGSYETQDAAKRQLAVLTRSGVRGIVTTAR